MRWIAVLIIVLAGCAHTKPTLRVEFKPKTQDWTISVQVEAE